MFNSIFTFSTNVIVSSTSTFSVQFHYINIYISLTPTIVTPVTCHSFHVHFLWLKEFPQKKIILSEVMELQIFLWWIYILMMKPYSDMSFLWQCSYWHFSWCINYYQYTEYISSRFFLITTCIMNDRLSLIHICESTGKELLITRFTWVTP